MHNSYNQQTKSSQEFISDLGPIAFLVIAGLILASPVIALLLAIFWTLTGAYGAALGALWYLIGIILLGKAGRVAARFLNNYF